MRHTLSLSPFPFLLSFLFLTLSSFSGFAQGDLATDRPSESAAATLLPEGISRGEFGGWMNWAEAESGAVDFGFAAPLGVLRYGLSPAFELRAGAQFNVQVGEVDNALLGAKVKLPGGFWGEFDACWLAEFNVNPNAGWRPGTPVPMQHRLCLGTAIGHDWAVTANAGWLRDAGQNNWMASCAISRTLGLQGWSGFVEPFMYSDSPVFLNLGFQRQLPKAMQCDVVFGRNLGGPTSDFTVGLGLSLTLSEKS
jgi:hypothetical protein